jgi:hypothetical protein
MPRQLSRACRRALHLRHPQRQRNATPHIGSAPRTICTLNFLEIRASKVAKRPSHLQSLVHFYFAESHLLFSYFKHLTASTPPSPSHTSHNHLWGFF